MDFSSLPDPTKAVRPVFRPSFTRERVEVLGPPKFDPHARRGEILVGVGGQLTVWTFGVSVYSQLATVNRETDGGLEDNSVDLIVWKEQHVPRVHVTWARKEERCGR